jgi:hypothetical protein
MVVDLVGRDAAEDLEHLLDDDVAAGVRVLPASCIASM